MSALQKAFADTERSYIAAKSTVATATSRLMAQGPSGLPLQRTDLTKAQEQLRHFIGWVYAAVRPIAQRIAGQPIRVGNVRNKPRGTKTVWQDAKPLDSHPLLDLLADPNDLMVAWGLMYVTVASLEMTGRCLWWLPGKKMILPIPTSWIIGFEGATKIERFAVRSPYNPEQFSIPADESCYFTYPDPSDPHGAVSPLQAVGGAVDADEAITDSQIAMFRRGIHPSHAIIVGKQPHPDIPGGIRPSLTPAQQRQVIGAILKRYQGTSRHGEPIILDGLIEDVKSLSMTPKEMDWLRSGQVTKSRIFQAFGVNPIIAGEIEGANRASAAAADKHFVDWCVNPKIELMSQVLTEYLGPMFDGVTVWIEPCLSDDTDMRLSWAQLLAMNGVLTANELRELSPLGLKATSVFDNTLVGGQNMETSNPIEAGIKAIFRNEIADLGAQDIFQRIGAPTRGEV